MGVSTIDEESAVDSMDLPSQTATGMQSNHWIDEEDL